MKIGREEKKKICFEIRGEIAKNIYKMNRCCENKTGVRFLYEMIKLQEENTAYIEILKRLECKNIKEIKLTMEPRKKK